jgi:hypothetical protein
LDLLIRFVSKGSTALANVTYALVRKQMLNFWSMMGNTIE